MDLLCDLFSPCPQDTPPYTNLSTEAPDQDIFIGLSWGLPQWLPELGSDWTKWWCYGECDSTISQADADECAFIMSLLCNTGVNKRKDPTAPTNQSSLFYNSPQTCAAYCPDGTAYTFTVYGGIYAASSQILADRIAYTAACKAANLNKHCPPKPVCPNVPLSPAYDVYSVKGVKGASNFAFSVTSGSLPPGVTLHKTGPTTAILTGTPTTPGDYSWTVSAHYAVMTAIFIDKMCVIGITSPDPTPAIAGVAYSFQMTAPCGSTFSVDDSMTPSWLTVSSNGLIVGTPGPSDAGITFQFDVAIISTSGKSCTQTVEILVEGCSNSITMPDGMVGNHYAFQFPTPIGYPPASAFEPTYQWQPFDPSLGGYVDNTLTLFLQFNGSFFSSPLPLISKSYHLVARATYLNGSFCDLDTTLTIQDPPTLPTQVSIPYDFTNLNNGDEISGSLVCPYNAPSQTFHGSSTVSFNGTDYFLDIQLLMPTSEVIASVSYFDLSLNPAGCTAFFSHAGPFVPQYTGLFNVIGSTTPCCPLASITITP